MVTVVSVFLLVVVYYVRNPFHQLNLRTYEKHYIFLTAFYRLSN
jgi:Ni,Fe-hydrogenase I cytochrome b subunit